MTLNLEGTNTREDFLAKVMERVVQTERNKWLTGRGWIETFWKPPQFPTRTDLDKITPGNPVFLTRADGHAAIVNSAALNIGLPDRKSTRLNSSHITISYAVFCLKKKNNTIISRT